MSETVRRLLSHNEGRLLREYACVVMRYIDYPNRFYIATKYMILQL